MKTMCKLATLALVPLVAACANGGSQEPSPAVTTVKPRVETRAMIRNKCILSPKNEAAKGESFLATAAAIFLPKIIDKGVDAFAAAIRKASERKEKSVSATAVHHFHKLDLEKGKLGLNPDLGCLIVARGNVQGTAKFAAETWKKAKKNGPLTDKLGIKSDPE